MKFFLTAFLIISLASCTLPGKGAKAERSYKALSPVLNALTVYFKNNGSYPKKLQELVPKYLKSVPEKLNRFPVTYIALNKQKDFELRFKYSGPGLNWCDYKTTLKKWKCGGAF